MSLTSTSAPLAVTVMTRAGPLPTPPTEAKLDDADPDPEVNSCQPVVLGKPSHGVPGVTGTDGAEEGPTPALLDTITARLYAWVVSARPLVHVTVVALEVCSVVRL